MNKKIFLHVGHAKTGSSFIQSFLANNTEQLAEQGFYYPEDQQVHIARDMRVSGGNFQLINEFERIESEAEALGMSLVLSGEALFDGMLEKRDLFELLLRKGYDVNILLFIRNPFDVFRSAYIQSVKRGGYNGTFDDHCERKGFTLDLVGWVGDYYQRCQEYGAKLKIVNFDKHRAKLLQVTAGFLGADISRLKLLDVTINRSLNDAEIFIQSKFNEYYGKNSAAFISDRLCDELPELTPSELMPSQENYTKLVNNLNQSIASVNALLGEGCEKYEPITLNWQPNTADRSDGFFLSKNQLEVLIKSLSEKLRGD